MPYSQNWLEDTAVRRCILIKATVYDVLATSEISIYMSTTGYITSDSSVMFLPIVSGGLSFTESISEDGSTSASYGDVEIINTNGDYDSWLDSTKYVWSNRAIQLYYGDPSWVATNFTQVTTDFELIFDGIISDIDSKSRDTINLKIRDKLERLNNPITENKLGTYGTWNGGQTNQDSIRPLVFGEVHNVEPLLIDPSILEYMMNDGNTENLIELRDNGVPIYSVADLPGGATVSLATGKFTLTYPIYGVLTASLQGVKNSIDLSTGNLVSGSYVNRVANLIALITTQYGKSYSKLSNTDLDLDNLQTFDSANTQTVGIIITDRDNLLSVCEALASSLGAQLFFTRKGKLQLLKYGVPTSDASVTITDNDILHHSLNIVNRTKVIAATKLAYAKNWTIQTNLLTAIPQQHKDLYATEWLTVTIKDDTIRSLYKLNVDPIQKDTYLITTANATTEATRLNDYFKTVRTTYGFTGTSKLLSLKVGQPVVLQHNRFGLSSGLSGQVVSLSPNWSKGQVGVEVLI